MWLNRQTENMAFMVPLVKKDYDIYSKSPPKNKPLMKKDSHSNNSSNNNSSSKLTARQQSNSITLAMIQHQKLQKQKNPQRTHSKSVNDNQIYRNNRNRSTSGSSTSDQSSESLEFIRKMMHFISFDNNSNQNNNNENSPISTPKQSNKSSKDSTKVHWTAKIFKRRKNSLNSHKIS